MAGEPNMSPVAPADLAPAPAPTVNAYDRVGNPINLPASDVPELLKMGGRLPSEQELAQQRADARAGTSSFAEDTLTAGPAYAMGKRTTGALVAAALGREALAPVEAYAHGVNSGMTVGFGQVAAKEALRQVAGDDAAAAYAQQAGDLAKAYPGSTLAGNAAGMVASTMMGRAPGAGGALARMGPAGLIEAGGNFVGKATGNVLEGLAARGIGGQVLATGAKVGLQAGVEGALYGAAAETTEALLHDKPLVAEHIFASSGLGALGGGAFGFGLGSAGAGALAGATRLRPSLERALTRGIESLATSGEKAITSEAGQAVAKEAVREGASVSKALSDVLRDDTVRGMAADQAWRATGAGTGAAKRFADRADKYLASSGGTRAVGEVLLRRGVIDTQGTVAKAAMEGTARDLAPRIATELEVVGKEIGNITRNSPGTLRGIDVVNAVHEVEGTYRGKAGFGHVADGVASYKDELVAAMNLASFDQKIAVQDLLAQRKNLDQLIYAEGKPLTASARVEALREVRTNLEDLVMRSMDEAAAAEGKGVVSAEYKALKRDYQALSIAHDAATDAATRSSRNRGLSPTDYATGIAAAASGHPFSAPVAAIAHNFVRTRGNAAAAVLLSRLADAGTVANIGKRVTEWTDRAARGVLSPAASSAPRRSLVQGDIVARAQRIVQNVRRAQATPEAVTDRVTRETQALARWAPETSLEYARTANRATQALYNAIPQTGRVDPLDPNSPPRLTREQALKVVQAAEYLDKPETLFRDLEAGRISPEGMAIARAVMPRTVEALQDAALAEVARRKLAGKPVDFAQRTRMTLLLGAPFDPLYRPQNLAALQAANALTPSPKTDPGPAAPHKPVALPKSLLGSTLDRVEQR